MDLSRMFFQEWSGLLRTFLVGVLAYVALVAWPVAHMSIHKRLTVPVRSSGSIRKKDTSF